MPNSNRMIKEFIRTAIEHHVYDEKESDYNRLVSLMDRELLVELSAYLKTHQEKKFYESMRELLEDNDFRAKILLLIELKKHLSLAV